MTLNLNKTKEMILHNFQGMSTAQHLQVENICIERVATVCVLGVNLEDNLS